MSVVLSKLTKIYGHQKAVDSVSLEALPGQIVGFLGPNGAGKSTTMKIITAYLNPTEGEVEVCGINVRQHSLEARRKIGYLPEHNPLYLDMYVKEFLRFAGRLQGMNGKQLTKSVEEIVELCGLGLEQNKKIGALSRGYRQRVGLAQAFIHHPPVLILDEPTSGLDPNQIVEIRNLIQTLGSKKTVIFSTHIMQEVQAICHRAVIINKGKIVADSLVENLKAISTEKMVIEAEFENPVEIGKIEGLENVTAVEKTKVSTYEITANTSEDIRNKISRLALENNWIILGLKVKENSLEEVFRELTQSKKENK